MIKPENNINLVSIYILRSLLEKHDWYYNYSDDSRYFRKGEDELKEIRRLVLLLGDEGDKLFKEHLHNSRH